MKVEDIMSRDPFYVEEGVFVTKARQLIRDNHLRGLPVQDSKGTVIGVVSDRDMLRITSTRSNVTIDGFTLALPLITPEMDAMETARIMLRERASLLTVVKSPEEPVLKGVISLIDVFKHMDLDRVPDRSLGEIMSKEVVTTSPKDPITKVWDMMLEGDFTGIPVVHDGKPVGMITRFDLIRRGWARLGKEGRSHSRYTTGLQVEKLMNTPLYSLEPDDSLRCAMERMLKLDVGRLSVLKDQSLVGKLTGMISLKPSWGRHK